MAKTLCDWSRKDIANKPLKLARLINRPRFYCAKCARCANQAKSLCQARKMPVVDERAAKFEGEMVGARRE